MAKKKTRTKAARLPKRKARQAGRGWAGKELFAETCAGITPAHCAAYDLFMFSEPDALNPKQRKAATEAVLAFANVGWIAYHNRPRT